MTNKKTLNVCEDWNNTFYVTYTNNGFQYMTCFQELTLEQAKKLSYCISEFGYKLDKIIYRNGNNEDLKRTD
jgi:hypothetical protein